MISLQVQLLDSFHRVHISCLSDRHYMTVGRKVTECHRTAKVAFNKSKVDYIFSILSNQQITIVVPAKLEMDQSFSVEFFTSYRVDTIFFQIRDNVTKNNMH